MRNPFYVVIVSFALVGCGQVPTLRQSSPVSRGAGVVHQIAQQGDGSQWLTLTPPQPLGQTVGITQAPDGKMWFTQDNLHSVVGKVDMYGKFVEYPVSAVPLQIIESGGGALWFVEIGPGTVGRITTPGKLTEFPIPFAGASPSGLTAGAVGNIWVADNNIGAPKSID
jgi:streptogramin lyase